MKISSIGPFTAPHTDDLDRELELEVAGLSNPSAEPLPEMEAGAEPSDEDHETREGLIRLVDYLARKAQKRERRTPTRNKRRDQAMRAYDGLEDFEERTRIIGQNLNRKV